MQEPQTVSVQSWTFPPICKKVKTLKTSSWTIHPEASSKSSYLDLLKIVNTVQEY